MEYKGISQKLYDFFSKKYPLQHYNLSISDLETITSSYLKYNRLNDTSIQNLIKIIESKILSSSKLSNITNFTNLSHINPKPQSKISSIDSPLPPPIVQTKSKQTEPQITSYQDIIRQIQPNAQPQIPPFQQESTKITSQILQMQSQQMQPQQIQSQQEMQKLPPPINTSVKQNNKNFEKQNTISSDINNNMNNNMNNDIKNHTDLDLDLDLDLDKQITFDLSSFTFENSLDNIQQESQEPLQIINQNQNNNHNNHNNNNHQQQLYNKSKPQTFKNTKLNQPSMNKPVFQQINTRRPIILIIDSKERNIELYNNPSFFVIQLLSNNEKSKGSINGNWNEIKSASISNFVILDTDENHPYLILKIKELGENTFSSSNNTLASAFAILTSYTVHGKYRYYNSDNIIHNFDEPINLNQLTIELLTPDGSHYNFGDDNKLAKHTILKFELKINY